MNVARLIHIERHDLLSETIIGKMTIYRFIHLLKCLLLFPVEASNARAAFFLKAEGLYAGVATSRQSDASNSQMTLLATGIAIDRNLVSTKIPPRGVRKVDKLSTRKTVGVRWQTRVAPKGTTLAEGKWKCLPAFDR
jgi:hypothetical protein